VVDPQCVVLAGSLGEAGAAELARRVHAALTEISPLAVDVLVSATEGNAILHGAVRVAMAAMHAQLFGGAAVPR
jgi:hypothetical protein